MKKAIIIITTIVLAVQLTLLQPIQTQAVGVDTVVKLVGGKAVIRALAEKAGVAMSKKQLDNTVNYIQKQSYDGNQKAIDFSKNVNALNSTGDGSKSGFKKYVVDPFNWITGLDLIFGAIMAFQQGYDSGSDVPLYGQCISNPIINTTVGYKWALVSTSGTWYMFRLPLDGSISFKERVNSPWIMDVTTTNGHAVWTQGRSSNPVPDFSGSKSFLNSITSGGLTGYDVGNGWKVEYFDGMEGVCQPVPTAQDVVNITNINNNTVNHFNNDTYNQNTTYNLEIELPDVVNYDDPTAWNEYDPNIDEEVDPVEPDSDGDGIPDSADPYPNDPTNEPIESKPDGGSWWEWLLAPLKAIADFITGLAEFLLGLLVPTAESVTGVFDGISTDFKAKLPIADQLGSFFGEIEKVTIQEATAPTFNVTMPEEWGGGTFSIIDFSYFDQWRSWILNFIRFAAWFIFLKRLYNRIPKMIY